VTTTSQSIVVVSVAACLSIVSSLPVVANAAPGQSRAPGASEACSLLTKEDAATALGEPATGPTHSASTPEASSCEFSGSGLHKVNLSVMHLAADTAGMYKALCAQKGKQGLTGLGDVTCWYNDKHEELQVLKGTTLLSIELRRSGDPTEAIKGVAQRVYSRLK
jgi:hypothetical protein